MALKVGDYKTDVHNDWCPGCGDFGIVNAIQMALAEMETVSYTHLTLPTTPYV